MTCRAVAVVIALPVSFAIVGAQQSADQVIVPLTDPARVVSLNLQLVKGSITVRGSNRRDVLVVARARGGQQQSESGGDTRLRLVQARGFTVTENHNEVLFVLHTPERALDFEIQVPSHANLKLGTTDVRAPIAVEGVDGDLEVNNPGGPITLTRVGGSIVASSVDGDVRAVITSVSTQRPMALSSFNRDVDVTFPSSLKANLRLRSDQGKMFTEFDMTPMPPPAGQNARFPYGGVNGGGPEIELRTFSGNVYARRGQ